MQCESVLGAESEPIEGCSSISSCAAHARRSRRLQCGTKVASQKAEGIAELNDDSQVEVWRLSVVLTEGRSTYGSAPESRHFLHPSRSRETRARSAVFQAALKGCAARGENRGRHAE